jgi:hypothetical protein
MGSDDYALSCCSGGRTASAGSCRLDRSSNHGGVLGPITDRVERTAPLHGGAVTVKRDPLPIIELSLRRKLGATAIIP